jgi:predicted heme/steroid binding protein/uncharacterized membrane protein
MTEQLHSFTIEDLKRFNGQNGSPVYIAYEGRVFDVTASRFWHGGMHMKRHTAGRDLTSEMSAAPHDLSVLERFPQIGVLVPAARPSPMGRSAVRIPSGRHPGHALSAAFGAFLERHPFFRRHPHPMSVHFPIVFMISSPIFTLLYLTTGFAGFEVTAINCLAAGLLFCLVVIPTGLLTWWINYEARPMRQVTVKIVISSLMFADGLAAFVWRLLDPRVITGKTGPSVPWLFLDFLLLPMVVVVAWYGAALTFPLTRAKRSGTGSP